MFKKQQYPDDIIAKTCHDAHLQVSSPKPKEPIQQL